MRTIACAAFAVLLAFSAAANGQGLKSPYPTMAPVERYLMTRTAEIEMARSAAPPSVSANAGVLVLTTKGYVVADKGNNGWVCLVERSWMSGFDDPEFWNPRGRGPSCFNPPAVQSVLPQYLARTTWALAGATRDEIAKKSQAAYASHQFTDPAPGSFSLMQSKEGYLNDEVAGPWYPHVMPFVAQDQTASVWAAGLPGSPVILGPYQRAYEPNTIFIIVRRWSDGSRAPK